MALFGKKIMIIDDDSIDRFILKKVLVSITNAEIIEYDSAVEALENITGAAESKHLPELIFLDLNMPVLDGFGFLDALEELSREYNKRFRIILISAYKNELDGKKISRYASVIAYFEKPVKKESLLELKKQFGIKRAS